MLLLRLAIAQKANKQKNATYMHQEDERYNSYFEVLNDFLFGWNVALQKLKELVDKALTHAMIMCYKLKLIFSRVSRSSSHSGYQLAQKSITVSLSACRSLIYSNCCIENSLISRLTTLVNAGALSTLFTTPCEAFLEKSFYEVTCVLSDSFLFLRLLPT